ncbi:multidrug efflux SMR transporter [Fodinisporobacter ferrooxydans]|uniref:Multidrug efflux SMR transporter n=2 Tax=Fodinisporobacter ferrooxydans TaxID=2901836 RepID=A0ABY4CGJ6_9BACL|nr:multidrug efflux SMR transporter [Alicyclobacillaceae bacterium MYW30-H2]
MSWVLLFFAIILEFLGTFCTKLSHGFERTLPSVLMFIFYFGSMITWNFALKKIDVSIGYAVWSGLGIAFTAIVGMWYFKEPVTVSKLFFTGLIIVGVVGLSFKN